MQTVLDAAAQIAQEIEKTRQRLATLEQALGALQPLIATQPSTPALALIKSDDIQTIEDVRVVKPARKARAAKKLKPVATKAKTSAKKQTSAIPKLNLPKTGAALWLNCLGRKKLTLNELADAALRKLELGEESQFAISNRASAWLNTAVKNNIVSVKTNKAGRNVYQVVRV